MAEPTVSGKRIILPLYRKTLVLGTFSNHEAAILAYIELKGLGEARPGLVRLSSDRTELALARERLANYRSQFHA